MDKRGITLSINMIVIIILAVVTLMMVLGFMTGVMQEMLDSMKGFPKLEIPPTPNDPISFIPAEIIKGKDNKMTIGFYNDEDNDITPDIKPVINCADVGGVTVKAAGLNILVGGNKKYAALVSVPTGTPDGTYSCTMTISETETTFFMVVR